MHVSLCVSSRVRVQQQLGRPAPALLTVNRVVAWLSSRAHWPRSLALALAQVSSLGSSVQSDSLRSKIRCSAPAALDEMPSCKLDMLGIGRIAISVSVSLGQPRK
eukprot:scaffold11296_cov128-Isochrysis_galbana.AAC.2